MRRPSFFLRTKLLPPRAVSELLERPRLLAKLQANLNSPVTMVAADAGCGKTTLIADFLRRQKRPSVWYQLDHTDADPFVFLGYIAQGIRNFAPDFGGTIFSYLEEANEELLSFPERAADLLLNEILESIDQPFILVLDDYHHIGRQTVVHTVLDRILQYSSDILHVIITTRDLPPLAITRRRSQSTAMLITREELLFTDDEVRALFQQALNISLSDGETAEYRNRTHGWITALQLVRQIAEQEMHDGDREPESLDLHTILQRSEKNIFDYFAEEVFSHETEESQRLLMHLSLLESLPLDVCSKLFPDMRCSAALPELAGKNVFLSAAGDGGSAEVYRFHPLFKDFLARRLRSEIGQAGVAAEKDRIADHFLAANQWEAALPHLLEAENFDKAAKVIAASGAEWISAGAITSLSIFADRIPAEILDRHPRSLLYKAEVARLQGDSDRAAALLHRAVGFLRDGADAEAEAEALHSLASLERRRNKCSEAFELLGRAEKLAKKDSVTFLKCANTRGLCLIMQGEWAEAEQQFRFALDLAEKQGNDHYIRLITHNLALAPGLRGDFGEALRWFKRIFRDDVAGSPLPQEAIGHLNAGRLHLYRGEFEETEKHLARSLELCQLYNLRSLRGEIFEAYANYYREKNDLTHAGEYYERAAKAYDEAEIDVLSREFNEERAKFYMMRGDLKTARTLLEKLVAFRKQANNVTGMLTARFGLARLDLAEGKTEGLAEEVRSLVIFFSEQDHYYDEALASMLLAEVNFKLGNLKGVDEPLQRALDLSARFDFDHWLRTELRRIPEMFADDNIADRLPADLREELADAQMRKPEAAAELGSDAATLTDLTIEVLGPVNIYRDATQPFAPDAWTTRRARDIFCYIATGKNRRVAKDVLIEAFWPDVDPQTVEKNFHPTISHIRKALNSRQPFKQNFLVFRDGAYQLNPELSFSIDSEEFELHIAEAEVAKREKNALKFRENLESAYKQYRGEFMAGVYEPWAEERRGFYAEQFLRVVTALAKLSFSDKNWSGALKYAGEVLRDDPYREDMHRLVMKILSAQGKPAAVKKQYDALQQLLKTELGIEPSTETRRVFQELLK